MVLSSSPPKPAPRTRMRFFIDCSIKLNSQLCYRSAANDKAQAQPRSGTWPAMRMFEFHCAVNCPARRLLSVVQLGGNPLKVQAEAIMRISQNIWSEIIVVL